MRTFRYGTFLFCLTLFSGLFNLFAQGEESTPTTKVIVSIKPIHSLVAAIMEGDDPPMLLVDGAQSPHGYQLRPSQIETLHHADIVFYTAPEIESFLVKPLQTLSSTSQAIALINAPGLTILGLHSGGAWRTDESNQTADRDPHIWLDPENAKAIAHEIARVLKERYPENTALYDTNEQKLEQTLDALNSALSQSLTPYENAPFIVFHDAYQYFIHAYSLHAVGAITLEPEQEPGIKRIAQIRDIVKSAQISCVFSEPQFSPRLVQAVTDGTGIKVGALDPLGADLVAGPDLYPALLRHMSDNVTNCLQ